LAAEGCGIAAKGGDEYKDSVTGFLAPLYWGAGEK